MPGSIDLQCKSGEPWHRRVESQVYQDGRKHIYQMHSDSQTISCGFASILHHLYLQLSRCGHTMPQWHIHCEEVAQLVLILQSMMEEYRVCIQPHFACLFVQAVNCFIKFFTLCTLPLRSCHHVVCCNTVRAPTGNFLIASSLYAHAELCLLVGQVDEVTCKLPSQLLCFLGQKEDLFCMFLGQPYHCKGCIQLHIHGWPTTGDKLIHTRSHNTCWWHKHLLYQGSHSLQEGETLNSCQMTGDQWLNRQMYDVSLSE